MVNINMPEYLISVDLLRPGVFIRLEKISWFDHPFLFNGFTIKDEEQIATLRQLGVTEVICIPEKSDALPLNPKEKSISGEKRRSFPKMLLTICGRLNGSAPDVSRKKRNTLPSVRFVLIPASALSTLFSREFLAATRIPWKRLSPLWIV